MSNILTPHTFIKIITTIWLSHTFVTNGRVLTHVGRYYLPADVGVDGTEAVAVDTVHSLIFSANGAESSIDVIFFDATEENIKTKNVPMTLINQIFVSTGSSIPSIVKVPNRNLVIATTAPINHAESVGSLVFIGTDGVEIATMELANCYLPDYITTTSDGLIAIVACEGEPDDNTAEFPEFNPPGAVAMIDISDPANPQLIETVSFEEFDIGGTKILPDSIYLPHKNQAFSINAEPEYITIDDDDKFAYITLQENNGIAVLNIDKREIVSIYSLGVHHYSRTGLDASNKDDAINIQTYDNLYGLRMPDSLDFVSINGKQFIVTANEGDSKDFDEERVEDVTLDPIQFPNADELQQIEVLGRLKIIKGLNEIDGKYKSLTAFGSRDFTIFQIKKDGSGDVEDIALIYSSMDDFEQLTAEFLGTEGFNTDLWNFSFDKRSDDKGPEPEGLTIGKCTTRRRGRKKKENVYAFIGLERVGGIMVYRMTEHGAKFVEYHNNRDFNVEHAEDSRPPENAGDSGPETLVYVDDNTYVTPLLFVSFTQSSSIGIYSVNCGYKRKHHHHHHHHHHKRDY